MVRGLIFLTVPVVFVVVEHVGEELKITAQLRFLPSLQEVQHLLLRLLYGVKLPVNIGQRGGHKEHSRITWKLEKLCLSLNAMRSYIRAQKAWLLIESCKVLPIRYKAKIEPCRSLSVT